MAGNEKRTLFQNADLRVTGGRSRQSSGRIVAMATIIMHGPKLDFLA